MKVVVTGGAGFIGANLCRALVDAAGVERVTAIDDFSTGRLENISDIDDIQVVEGSVLDAALLDQAIGDAQAVVHLAARPSVPRSLSDPVATHEANASGTLSVLEAVRRHPARERPHVIVASSSSVYGANPGIPKQEDMATMPASPYAASKLAAEAYAVAYGRSFGLEVLVFRFFNVFGPLQTADHAYAAVVPTFIHAALRGKPLTIHGDGSQTRDFTYVGSVVEVLEQALRRRVTEPNPLNLAFGSRVSILELAQVLESVIGNRLELVHDEPRTGDVAHSQADQTRLRSTFPDAVPVPLDEGIRMTVDWARQAWT